MRYIFSERINAAMAARNINSVALSDMTGIDQKAIESYMADKYKANPYRTHLIADALGVSMAWLMGSDVPMDYK